ncbi:MAG: hypothetical protein HY361_03830 [Candidatus Aenigmarchaeota archaeon]|nr:hypothetical protein [Candidatus Aenigmarchaeota archaeon]
MGKGQTVILLAVVVVAVLFLFFSPQIFGPTTTVEPIRFKNDIITLQNFEVSNSKPIQNSVITISYDLTNNGDRKVNEVTVDFSGSANVIGGNFKFEECELSALKDDKTKICVFKDLESLEARKVTARFQVGGAGSQNIEVKVKYQYNGTREALIPIIDDKTIRKPPVQFSQSQPSFGPFLVDIIPPTKGWAISNQPFDIKFKLKYLGSALAGTPTTPNDKLNIGDDNFIVKLTQLEVAIPQNEQPKIEEYSWKLSSERNQETCKLFGEQLQHKSNILPTTIFEYDYCSNLEKIEVIKNPISCPTFIPAKIKGENYLINEKAGYDILVNKEYACNLQASNIKNDIFGYKLGIIQVSFFYTFEFARSQNIVVREAA